MQCVVDNSDLADSVLVHGNSKDYYELVAIGEDVKIKHHDVREAIIDNGWIDDSFVQTCSANEVRCIASVLKIDTMKSSSDSCKSKRKTKEELKSEVREKI
jgi:hypothetical protein